MTSCLPRNSGGTARRLPPTSFGNLSCVPTHALPRLYTQEQIAEKVDLTEARVQVTLILSFIFNFLTFFFLQVFYLLVNHLSIELYCLFRIFHHSNVNTCYKWLIWTICRQPCFHLVMLFLIAKIFILRKKKKTAQNTKSLTTNIRKYRLNFSK